MVDTFADMQDVLLPGGQTRWRETMTLVLSVSPQQNLPRPEQCVRGACWALVRNLYFQLFIVLTILFNTLLMALEGDTLKSIPDAPMYLALMYSVCNWIFAFEAAGKIAAYSFRGYMADNWNVFDFSLVALALVDMLTAATGMILPGLQPTLLRVLRVLRAARVLRTFRIARSVNGLRSLLKTVVLSLPALANILGLYVVVLFTFSVLGMELFSKVVWGHHLNVDANFCDFPTAMLTLFRCSTGEGWNNIMHDLSIKPGEVGDDGRTCSETEGNCGSWLAIPYFAVFVVFSSFIILKMMIAVVIENFKSSLRNDSYFVKPAHTDSFVEAWAEFDPLGSARLPVDMLPALLRKLPPPLGLEPNEYKGRIRHVDLTRYIIKLHVKCHPSEFDHEPVRVVLFHELLMCLTEGALHREHVQKMAACDVRSSSPVLTRAKTQKELLEAHTLSWARPEGDNATPTDTSPGSSFCRRQAGETSPGEEGSPGSPESPLRDPVLRDPVLGVPGLRDGAEARLMRCRGKHASTERILLTIDCSESAATGGYRGSVDEEEQAQFARMAAMKSRQCSCESLSANQSPSCLRAGAAPGLDPAPGGQASCGESSFHKGTAGACVHVDEAERTRYARMMSLKSKKSMHSVIPQHEEAHHEEEHESHVVTVAQEFAVVKLQRHWRNRQLARKAQQSQQAKSLSA
uniref:Calcium-channel protein CCH1 n=1 Tax=Haptolina ericina TaxID=156174 RepID=A0A7S3F8C9_9EUKA